ncbi:MULTISPECIES: hypothetical protein [unclassified Rhizobium]|uniref:hypothetical protein n=1 Tax=unclassified Rhizobium TaxID=2613769 RepID=UPI00161DDABE|nr:MULTISPECIES: hypothetical protein [unclassified Rhizobium]MBB3297897.1 hypothetical protein [Rhizobium sp. BK112]MBB4177608.1 hypothetical protein [Rhizobium sp. BK109]
MSAPEIAALDRALARAGETIVLRKSNAASPSIQIMAHVRKVSSDEIDGTTIRQNDRKVIISPTGLEDFGLPQAGGFALIDNEPHAIIGKPDYMKMADTVVRIEMFVKG